MLTPRQLEAIGLGDPPRDTCVVAGPGSGKTTVLIETFRRLVEQGTPPLRILAITFTEKATHEMKQRLGRAFADRVELRRQVERAWVSTVHGFCARLLREKAVAAGVDPQFRILGEQQADLLERRSAADALDEFLAEQPGAMEGLLDALASPDLAGALREVYDAVRAAGRRLHDLREPVPSWSPDPALVCCREIAAERVIHWTPAQREQWRKVVEWGERLAALPPQPSPEHFRVLEEFDCNLGRVRKSSRAGERMADLKNRLIGEALAALSAAWYASQCETLLAVLDRFDSLYRARKREAGALDFDDLEEYTVALLRGNAAIRDEVRSQFDFVLMDEFQDTNGVQAALVELVRKPDRFYAVGDINQSIYGFRHADPGIFRAFREQVRAGGRRVIELPENFRSRAQILEAARSFVDGSSGVEAHELVAARQFPPASPPSVEVIACPSLELEARWVARRVRDFGAFGETAVLFRSSTHMGVFTGAFADLGIPFVVTGGKGFYETQEVADLVNLLRVVANVRDEMSLAAVLRSPLVGASDETLLRLRAGGNLGAALLSLDASEDLEALLRFRQNLVRYRRERDVVPFDRMLIHAMDETGYEAALTPRARANVEKFLASAREAFLRGSLNEFVDELALIRASDPREPDSQSEETGDFVRVQTIHSAKGLEFPIVFLPALQAGVRNERRPILFSPRSGLGVRWRSPVSGEKCGDSCWEAIRSEVERNEAEEADRLLYVGMTRAAEHLVLSCSGRANWASYLTGRWGLDLDTPVLAPRRVGSLEVQLLVTDRPPESLPAEPRSEAAITPVLVPRPTVSGQHDGAASVTSVALFAHCPRRYYLERYIGWRGAPEPDEARDALDATSLGTQVHTLLAGVPVPDAAPEALELAGRFHASDLGRRAAATTLAEREFDFMLAVDGVVLSGRIDLWFEESGELIVVDYKTGEVDASESHSLQLRLYALALERYTGRPVDHAYLYLLRQDVAVPVDVSRAALDQAVDAVRALRDAQDRPEFPLHEGSHCRRCPYYQGLCPSNAKGDVLYTL